MATDLTIDGWLRESGVLDPELVDACVDQLSSNPSATWEGVLCSALADSPAELDRALSAVGSISRGNAPAATGDAMVSTEQVGRYVHEDLLGQGGMGRVTLAYDRHLRRHVARKELLADIPGSGTHPGTVDRFLREAWITAQLEHPGIVPVYEIGRCSDGSVYYTMMRVRGRTLAVALADTDGLKSRLALVGRFLDLCQAMAYAHSKGIVHRDLKPDNVMIGRFGETLVLDWGLAKSVDEPQPESAPFIDQTIGIDSGDTGRTRAGTLMGTPHYMSPEQARGEGWTVGSASDVWSLGAILYELLAGRRLFGEVGARDVLAQVRRANVVPVTDIEADAPRDLVAVVAKALAAEPEDRYADAGELAREVEAWESGRLVNAHAYSPTELIRRFVRRHRAPVGMAAVALVALAVVVTVASLRVVQERDRARAAEVAALDALHQAEQASARAELRGLLAEASRHDALGAWRREVALLRGAAEVARELDPAAQGGAPPQEIQQQLELAALPWVAATRLEGHDTHINWATHSPDGRLLVTACYDTIRVWDGRTGGARVALDRRMDDPTVRAIAVSPDGSLIATGSISGAARLWDSASGALIDEVSAHSDGLYSIAFSPDGALMASGGFDKTIALWDVVAGQPAGRLRWSDAVGLVAWTPDGSRLVGIDIQGGGGAVGSRGEGAGRGPRRQLRVAHWC